VADLTRIGTIALARIPRVIFGAYDPMNSGLVKSAEVSGGVLEKECRELLQNFFKTLRKQNNDSL